MQISGLTKETTYTVRCAQANNVDFSLRTFVDFTFTTRDEDEIVKDIHVAKIDSDSVTVSIVFSTTNDAIG